MQTAYKPESILQHPVISFFTFRLSLFFILVLDTAVNVDSTMQCGNALR